MPEYLTPGVYVEETSFRSRSVEGVPTSTFGMAGLTAYGPVPYVAAGAEMVPTPVLVTSMTEYERAFGGLSIGVSSASSRWPRGRSSTTGVGGSTCRGSSRSR